MKISAEKGRMYGVTWPWVRFVLCNPDITFLLNWSPLKMQKVGDKEFRGKGYGVSVTMRIVVDPKPDPDDEVNIITDVSMPFGLGRTYTVGYYRYRATGVSTTMVDLNFTLDTMGISMAIYFRILKSRINSVINKAMMDNERAGALLQEEDPSLKKLLNKEQLDRIDKFRREWGRAAFLQTYSGAPHPPTELHHDQVWHSELAELMGFYEQVEGKAILIEEEFKRMREMRDAVATLVVARRILEVIVIQICEERLRRPRGTEPLGGGGGVLGKIAREHIVPENIITSMENLNRLATYAAHPKTFSPRQVREALVALCSIMEWYVLEAMQPSQSCKE